MAKTGPINSCYECAGIHVCYGSKQPGISREQGREAAAACALLHKGRTTEVVRVVGRERGMSRKNAQELIDKGEAAWEGPSLLRFLGQVRMAGAALKAAKAEKRAAGGGGEDAQAAKSPVASGRKPAVPGGRWHRPGGVWRADDPRAARPGANPKGDRG